LISRLILSIKIQDPAGQLNAWNPASIAKQINSQNFGFDLELKKMWETLGHDYSEIDVTFVARSKGESSTGFGFKGIIWALREAVRIRKRYS
jgi:hypothetical protein